MFDWTDERTAVLTRLRAEGRTASQIAAEIGGGVTRNAVIGKWHRLDLPVPVVTKPVSAKALPRPKRQAATPAVIAPCPEQPAPAVERHSPRPRRPSVVEPAPVGAGLACSAIKDGSCRWPIGDPAADTFRFCAARCDVTKPYCDQHQALSIDQRRRTTRIMATAA